MSDALRPGDSIGILGGGQLGRMLALAAAPLGLKTHVFAPEPDSPAFDSCVIWPMVWSWKKRKMPNTRPQEPRHASPRLDESKS